MMESRSWTGQEHRPGCSERAGERSYAVRSMRAVNWQISCSLSLIFTDIKFSLGNIIFKRLLAKSGTCMEYKTFLISQRELLEFR